MTSLSGDDEFVKAVLIAFDQNPPQNESESKLKAAAGQYCEQVKNSKDGWKLCLTRLHQTPSMKHPGVDYIKFWCLEVTSHVVSARWDQLSDDERTAIRSSLMVYVRDVCQSSPQTNFIKTKLSVLLVRVFRLDYPHRWESFFTDFLSLLEKGPEVVDIFLRVLTAISQDVVERDETRASTEQKRNNQIKDAMRAKALPGIIDALYKLIVACQSSQPAIAREVLSTLTDYIGWIDIDLIANQKFIPLFYKFLTVPALQNEACQCVVEVVYKGISDRQRKLELLTQLKLFDVISGLNMSSYDDKFALNVAGLVNTLGTQLMEMVSSPKSPMVKGIDPSKPQMSASTILQECNAMLEQTMDLSFRFMEHKNYKVAVEVLDLQLGYIQYLKPASAASHTQKQIGLFRRIFVCTLQAMCYPEGFDFDKPDEKEEKFLEFRTQLEKLFTNQNHCNPDLAVDLVRASISNTLGNLGTLPWNKVEASLYLLFKLGELNVKLKKLADEPWKSLLGALFSSDISKHPHPQVSLMYFRLITRYGRFMESYPEFVGPVVSSLLDGRGIRHRHPVVRAEACASFRQLIKSFPDGLRAALKPHLDGLLQSLQQVIQPVISKGMKRGDPKDGLVQYEGCVLLCEAMGILVSSIVTGDKCKDYFVAILDFFSKALQAALKQKDEWVQKDAALAGKRISQIFNLMGNLSKSMIQEDLKRVADVQAETLKLVIHAYSLMPQHDLIRGKFINYLHQMIVCLGDGLLPFLPAVLESLVKYSTPSNITPFISLFNQLVQKYSGAFSQVADALFLPIVARLFEILQQYQHVDAVKVEAAVSADKIERMAVSRVYYTMLQELVSANLAGVLTSSKNAQHMQKVLETLLQGTSEPFDFKINKACFSTLRQLGAYWHTQSRGAVESSVKSFLFKDVFTRVLQCTVNPRFAFGDAAAGGCLREIFDLQSTFYKAWGNDYLSAVGEQLVSALGVSTEVAKMYCVLVAKDSYDDYRKYYVALVESKRRDLAAKKGAS